MGSIYEKNWGRKSRDTTTLATKIWLIVIKLFGYGLNIFLNVFCIKKTHADFTIYVIANMKCCVMDTTESSFVVSVTL